MKKLILLALTALCIACIIACGKSEERTKNNVELQSSSLSDETENYDETEDIVADNENDTTMEEENKDNLLVKKIIYYDRDSIKDKVFEYEYNEAKLVSKETTYSIENGLMCKEQEKYYLYDSKGNKIEEQNYQDGEKYNCMTWKYDEKGNVIEDSHTIYYSNNTEHKSCNYYFYTYDSNGKIIREDRRYCFNNGDEESHSIIFEYNDIGECVREIDENGEVTEIKKTDDGIIYRYIKGTQKFVELYSALLDEFVTETYTSGGGMGAKYDKNGNILEDIEITWNEEMKVQCFYEYDDNGKLVKIYNARDNQKAELQREYIRDERGNILQLNYYDRGSFDDIFEQPGTYIFEY